MEADSIIKTIDLTKRYGRQTAVDGLSFEIREGEVFGFLGPNGAGKTTTLLMLLGLSKPSCGFARVFDLDPLRNPVEVKRRVGFLPENVGFYGDLDAIRSLEYVASLNGIQKEQAREKGYSLLEMVGLGKDAHKRVGTFSRGMHQRLGIAEVLIKEPGVLFLDEPTLGLDPDGAHRIMDLIKTLNEERGISVLLSSHNLHHVQKISHRVGIMIGGRMVAEGSIPSLAKQKLGVDEGAYSLEEIYMKYFQAD